MNIPDNIQKIIAKEGIEYSEIHDILLNAEEVVDSNTWKIIIDRLIFPVDLNDEEVFELIEFYYLNAYDVAVNINMYYNKNEILIEGDKHFGVYMLALIIVLSIGVIAYIFMSVH